MALEHGKLPDPVSEAIRLILEKQEGLEERIRRIENSGHPVAIPSQLEREIEKIFRDGGGI
jgi:hypothetical protein